MTTKAESFHTTCCVVGGGPAGIMLGYLLARAGVAVTVLEKHKDFFRDFRGDTVHPSTLQVLHELGLLEDFLRIPHQKVASVRVRFGNDVLEMASLCGLRLRCPYIAFMPQWDFLHFLSEKGKEYPEFDLRMEHEAIDLVRADGRIRGVVIRTPEGIREIGAGLVIGCDGRHSATRDAGGFEVLHVGVPIDVLWFRLSRGKEDPSEHLLGNVNYGKALILLDRGDYYQAGLIIRKDSFAQVQAEGMEAFRMSVARVAPQLRDKVDELKNWGQVKLLSVQINRLRTWSRPGLLCIGDAAHAMSPAFGVGINLAIQDAVATANLLAPALRHGRNTDALLGQIQCRREFPTRATQFLQKFAHQGLEYVFRHPEPMRAPLPLKVAMHIPGAQQAVARVIGVGFRPEHVKVSPAPRDRLTRIAAFCAGVAAAAVIAWRGVQRNTA